MLSRPITVLLIVNNFHLVPKFLLCLTNQMSSHEFENPPYYTQGVPLTEPQAHSSPFFFYCNVQYSVQNVIFKNLEWLPKSQHQIRKKLFVNSNIILEILICNETNFSKMKSKKTLKDGSRLRPCSRLVQILTLTSPQHHPNINSQFKRLGDMVNGDGKTIVSCLKGSDTKLIQVAEDESKIRRNPEMVVPAFDDNYKRLQKNRTCYVKVRTVRSHSVTGGPWIPGHNKHSRASRLI